MRRSGAVAARGDSSLDVVTFVAEEFTANSRNDLQDGIRGIPLLPRDDVLVELSLAEDLDGVGDPQSAGDRARGQRTCVVRSERSDKSSVED